MPGARYVAGDAVSLRTVAPEDHERIAAAWNDPEIRHLTDEQEPVTAADVAAVVEGGDSLGFLPCRDGDSVGFAWLYGIDDIASRAELGYWIDEPERGRGYATETVELLVEYAVADRGLRRLLGRVLEGNEASARVLEKNGFEREGRLREHYWADGEYVDATLYGLVAD